MALIAPMPPRQLEPTGFAYGSVIGAAHLGTMTAVFTFRALAGKFGRQSHVNQKQTETDLFVLPKKMPSCDLMDSHPIVTHPITVLGTEVARRGLQHMQRIEYTRYGGP